MEEFIQKSLSPEIFWIALASIGTLFAVLVALFMPMLTLVSRNNRLERLIRAELDGNLKVIRNMTSRESRAMPDGVEISALRNNDVLVSHIDLRLWHQYRYDLASDRPDSYEKFQALNSLAEAIIDTPDHTGMRLTIQTDEASNFVALYGKEFGSKTA